MSAWTVGCPRPEDTGALGAALARASTPGTVAALVGELGAGKTCFAKGVGQGLEVLEVVVSPTFILIAQYEGRLPLLHADAYRLEQKDLPELGLEELLETWDGVALLEWADRFPDVLPPDHLVVRFVNHDLEITSTGPIHDEVLDRWRKAWFDPG